MQNNNHDINTWDETEDTCQGFGSHLATIDTQQVCRIAVSEGNKSKSHSYSSMASCPIILDGQVVEVAIIIYL